MLQRKSNEIPVFLKLERIGQLAFSRNQFTRKLKYHKDERIGINKHLASIQMILDT